MGKPLTYQSRNVFEWLLAITLAISITAYSGYTGFTDICQQQPEQVECVYSGQSRTGIETISFDQFFGVKLLHNTKKRSREYEAHVQAVLQNRIKVAIKTISELSVSCSQPFFNQKIITSLHSSEESSSSDIPECIF